MRKELEETLQPWGPEKKLHWFINQRVQRSYEADVRVPIEALKKAGGRVEHYGSLTVNPEKFPLYAVRVGDGSSAKPTVLVTGGVHGYETSGVKGALLFLQEHAALYTDRFNFVVLPCISPWSYETVNRLDPVMENPNREFRPEGRAEESRLAMDYLNKLGVEFAAHIDLHETTNSDKVFLPEEYAKNGKRLTADEVDIPDGFYLIGTITHPRPELEKAMMDSVRKVTHIAKPDARGMILDTALSQEGVIHNHIPGLCAEFTGASARLGAYTTEMYPDSERFNTLSTAQVEALCSEAQVACVRGALDFWSSARST
jgi:predicted deacylase